MTTQEIEDLYVRSFDDPMNSEEKELLLKTLRTNTGLATDIAQHKKIREVLSRKEPATFGPYFAKKVIAKIQNVGIQIDRQILAFFKKYQLAAVGVVIALLALNAVFADQLNLQSLFGLENTSNTADDIVSFDFFETLNTDL
ncbi:MAG: hypothetical protein AABY93_04490 [Bacteroidota bacterium]